MIVTDEEELAKRAKSPDHDDQSTPHPYEYVHYEPGLQLPHTQPERFPWLRPDGVMLPGFLAAKREVAMLYGDFFAEKGVEFVHEPENAPLELLA